MVKPTTARGRGPGAMMSPAVPLTIAGRAWCAKREPRASSMSTQTRPTTVVSQPPMLSTASVSDRFSRSHASWTASCASPIEPSIRYIAFVSVGTVGLLVPLAAIFAGLSVIVDRHNGLVDHRGTGLHDTWGMSNTALEAWLSLAVVVLFAAAFIALSIRMFKRSAVS
jgi:hypothetical protein